VVDGEVAGAEVVAEKRRLVDGAARHLLEEHEHHAVDPRRRPRALVAYHLATCMRACMQPIIGNADMHTESPMHGFLLLPAVRLLVRARILPFELYWHIEYCLVLWCNIEAFNYLTLI